LRDLLGELVDPIVERDERRAERAHLLVLERARGHAPNRLALHQLREELDDEDEPRSAPGNAPSRFTCPAEERDSSREQPEVPAPPDEARRPDEPSGFLLLPPDLAHGRKCVHQDPSFLVFS